jgi:hypothetical protein
LKNKQKTGWDHCLWPSHTIWRNFSNFLKHVFGRWKHCFKLKKSILTMFRLLGVFLS